MVSPFYHGILFICFWKFLVGMGANSGLRRSIINIETLERYHFQFDDAVVGEVDELDEDVG